VKARRDLTAGNRLSVSPMTGFVSHVGTGCPATKGRTSADTDGQIWSRIGRCALWSLFSNELTFVSPPDAFEAGSFDYCVQDDVLSIFVAPTLAARLPHLRGGLCPDQESLTRKVGNAIARTSPGLARAADLGGDLHSVRWQQRSAQSAHEAPRRLASRLTATHRSA